MWRLLTLVFFCVGAVSAAPSGRVVNGTDAIINEYPYMVSLRVSNGGHSCGGSIISPNFAMTAAHCTNVWTASLISLQYGVSTISANGPNVVGVKRIIQHAEYNPWNSFANDISLLEVEKPFPIDYITVAPVKLPDFKFETPQSPDGAPGVLTGWGFNASDGDIMRQLQAVDLKIYSDDECAARHGGSTLKSHICGGVDEGGKGQCSGDSGGPLTYNGIQVGIVSWSVKPCTVAPYPGVYTKVAMYIDWIRRSMLISS